MSSKYIRSICPPQVKDTLNLLNPLSIEYEQILKLLLRNIRIKHYVLHLKKTIIASDLLIKLFFYGNHLHFLNKSIFLKDIQIEYDVQNLLETIQHQDQMLNFEIMMANCNIHLKQMAEQVHWQQKDIIQLQQLEKIQFYMMLKLIIKYQILVVIKFIIMFLIIQQQFLKQWYFDKRFKRQLHKNMAISNIIRIKEFLKKIILFILILNHNIFLLD